MAVNIILPKTITKDVLFKRAQERFQDWVKFYGDPTVSAQHMYEDMSCSCYSGSPEYDFPEEYKAEQNSTIRYQYKDGNCSFMIDGIEVEVMDLRSMRESPRVGKEMYSDVCVLTISYSDDADGMHMYHVIPNTWLYGSTSDDFAEGAEVQPEFINAARDFIKANHITPELQQYYQ